MRETVSMFCPNAKQEVIGLLKLNPSICSENIKTEYDFVYCTGKIYNCRGIKANCPLAKTYGFKTLH